MSIYPYIASFVISILHSSLSLSQPLDSLILGWEDKPKLINEKSNVYARSETSNWYKKDDKQLSGVKHELQLKAYSSAFNVPVGFSATSAFQEYRYAEDNNYLRAYSLNESWLFFIEPNNFRLAMGNDVQLISSAISDYGLTLKRERVNQYFELNAQASLDKPEVGQFIFYHDWEDTRRSITLESPNLDFTYHSLKSSNDNYGFNLQAAFNKFQHSFGYSKTNLDYGTILLKDPAYSYGSMNWINSAKRYIWSTRLEASPNESWELKLLKQKASFATIGQVSLFDIIGQSANLAGANWFWGVQGSFKNYGLSLSRQWSNQRWQHTWGVTTNKLTPYINSKIYKSLILIGLPKLESEDETDLEFAYLSQLFWSSKYTWSNMSVKAYVKQLIPLYIKEHSSGSSSSSGSDDSSSSSYTHTGYTAAIAFNWFFK